MSTILIIDDDQDLCELLAEFLESEGNTVRLAHDGQSGLDQIRDEMPDIAVMDIMMPVLGGFDALRKLRTEKIELPVIMLTARGDDMHKILGLELGADDYLAKPFNPHELNARIKAVLRRYASPGSVSSAHIQLEDVAMNLSSRQVFIGQSELQLTAAEFDILHTLLRAAGEVCTKELLTEQGLSRKLEMYDRSIDMHISNIRKKLGTKNDGSARIKTVRGIGYIYALTEQAQD